MDVSNLTYSERLECAYCHLDEKIETDGIQSSDWIEYIIDMISYIYKIDIRDLDFYYHTTY